MQPSFRIVLEEGLAALGLTLDAAALGKLERYADRLLAWNRKVNLTAVTEPGELAEKHLVDSLALVPFVTGAKTLLDVGSGAGLPGVPLAIACPGLQVTCCDSVGKKIAFVKAVSAELDVAVRGVPVRASGRPEADGLPVAERVVSRALAEPERWVPLGAPYVAPGGVLLAMLAQAVDEAALRALGTAHGLELVGIERFELPRSRAARAVARWRRP